MNVRPVTIDDHPQVCALLEQVDALHREALPEVFQGLEGPPRTRAWLAQRIADDEVALLVADRGGALLGLVETVDVAPPSSPLFQPERFAVVEELVVDAGQQRQGVGQRLLEEAHAWARARGLKQIRLNVWEFNAEARAFYEALGYTTLSRKLGRKLD